VTPSYWPSLIVYNPWAFITLLALALPLLLHLISKSQAVRVKFANIALINVLQPKSMRQIRLTEFWLLLLRVLLLLLSILLLAQVIITKPLLNHDEIYLVSVDWLNQSDQQQRQQLAMNSAKQPTYLLTPDFKEISAGEIRNWQQQDGQVLHQNILLQLAYVSQLLTPETNIKLFVTDRASQFSFNDVISQIVLANPITWQIQTLANDNYQQYRDAIKIVIIYDQDRFADLKYFQHAFSLLKQHVAPKLVVSYYSTKALDNSISYQQALQNKPDWLFYLSTMDINHHIADALTTGTTLFVEAKNDNVKLILPNILTANESNTDLLASEAIFYQWAVPLDIVKQLNRKIITQNDEVLWQYTQQDGSRLPMLTRTTLTHQDEVAENSVAENTHPANSKQKNHIYQLHSRFSPSWSNLLVTKHLPLFLQTLLFEPWQKQKLAEQQILTREQISQLIYRPDNIKSKSAKSAVLSSATLLATTKLKTVELQGANPLLMQQQVNNDFWTELLVVLFILLWALERIVSEFFRPKAHADSKNQQGSGTEVEKAQAVKSTKAID
tara:strand:+ start:1268 stop:2932 length:1665 start_codon:yes stop_codon:yes gene_type:complete